MIHPYHYSVIQCRDPKAYGEVRNAGVLIVAPAVGKAWLRTANFKTRLHMQDEDAVFMRAVAENILHEAEELVSTAPSAKDVADWMHSLSMPTEDSLRLTPPKAGVSKEIKKEIGRLMVRYTGAPPGRGGKSPAERVEVDALKSLGLLKTFGQRKIDAGPVIWKFPWVHERPDGLFVLHPLHFSQRTAAGMLDAAFKHVGRAREVEHFRPGSEVVTVASGPQKGANLQAFERAREVLGQDDHVVLEPSAADIVQFLEARGYGSAGTAGADQTA